MTKKEAILITGNAMTYGMEQADVDAARRIARAMPDEPWAMAGAVTLIRRGERPRESSVRTAGRRVAEAQRFLCKAAARRTEVAAA